MPIRVLFLCTGNSARSQMGEALLRKLGGAEFEVHSAGTAPRPELHPLAIEVMAEVGIDIGHQRPKDVSAYAGEHFDYVITVCDRAKETCPIFPGAHLIHWPFPDPAEATGDDQARLKAFRNVRFGLDYALSLFVAQARRGSRPTTPPGEALLTPDALH